MFLYKKWEAIRRFPRCSALTAGLEGTCAFLRCQAAAVQGSVLPLPAEQCTNASQCLCWVTQRNVIATISLPRQANAR